MEKLKLKKKLTELKKKEKKKKVKLIIKKRPDLNFFKPRNGKILDFFSSNSSTTSSNNNNNNNLNHHQQQQQQQQQQEEKQEDVLIIDVDSSSTGSPSKILSDLDSITEIQIESNDKKCNKKKSKKITQNKKTRKIRETITKKKRRKTKDESPDPDEDSNIEDIALSDYSEPETKLRDPEIRKESRKKFAKLRKARKQSHFKRLLNKEVNSKRIIPDSDDEIEFNVGPESNIEEEEDDENDDDDDDDSSGSNSTGDDSSETDEEEYRRLEHEFIVDDMATAEQRTAVKKRLQNHMPAKFRNVKPNHLFHFKTVCQYLVYHALLPQVQWRKRISLFDVSCKHFDDVYAGHAIPMLDTSGWIQKFRNELNNRPYIRLLTDLKGRPGCQACNNRTKISKKIIQLFGQPYSAYTLNPSEVKKRRRSNSDSSSSSSSGSTESYGYHSSSEPEDSGKQHKFKLWNPDLSNPSKPEFTCGEDCANRAIEYHYFKHWQLNLLKIIKTKIKLIKEEEKEKKFNILQKEYKHTDLIPNEEKLKKFKKEIREIFELIEKNGKKNSFNSLDTLFQRFMFRLNRVHKDYKTVG